MSDQPIKIVTEQLAVDSVTAADLLDFTNASLEKDRAVGHMGIPYVKAGRRVLYQLSDLKGWLDAHRVVPAPAVPGEAA